jgi:hypothetical protein
MNLHVYPASNEINTQGNPHSGKSPTRNPVDAGHRQGLIEFLLLSNADFPPVGLIEWANIFPQAGGLIRGGPLTCGTLLSASLVFEMRLRPGSSITMADSVDAFEI